MKDFLATAFWTLIIFLIGASVFLLVYLIHIPSAASHDWYPSSCCGGHDCHPVECDQLEERKDGWIIWHGPGFDLPFEKKRALQSSQDNKCHVCPHCVFMPQNVWQDNLNRWAGMYERRSP